MKNKYVAEIVLTFDEPITKKDVRALIGRELAGASCFSDDTWVALKNVLVRSVNKD